MVAIVVLCSSGAWPRPSSHPGVSILDARARYTDPVIARLRALVGRVPYLLWRFLPFPLQRLAVRVAVPRAPLGATILLRDDAGRVLLVRPSYQRGGVWSLPGGWANRGEDLRHAAEREALEELGIRVTAGRVVAARRGMWGELAVVFEGSRGDDAPFRLTAEISEARYFAPDALPPGLEQTRALVLEAVGR
jgi:ADP-ribose pyrophosphatase YjhB (NUDIX family)